MNFTHVPDRTAAEIRILVEDATGNIADPITAKGLRTFLLPPRQEMRTWDWHKSYVEYPVWVVDESSRYDYDIVFSDYRRFHSRE